MEVKVKNITLADKIENRIRSEKKKHNSNYWIKVCSIKLAHDFEFLLEEQKEECRHQIKAIVEESELRGVAKLLDSLWDNSRNTMGEQGSKIIEKEMIYYFGKKWSKDMYDFFMPNRVYPEPVKTLKEVSNYKHQIKRRLG